MAGVVAAGVAADGVSVATPEDDAELRALLRKEVMPGAVRVALTREPDFFAADGLAGADDVTLVSRRQGRIVGMGRLSVYTLMRNGLPQRMGYLGALRITSGTRESVRMLKEGYALLKPRAAGSGNRAASVDGYFTSIATDNVRARRVLEHGARFGLPSYRQLCDLVTLIAPVKRVRRGRRAWGGEPRAEERELLEFLRAESAHGQLTLAWDAARLESLGRHGISTAAFRVIRRDGGIVGAAAVWDQRAFRQTMINQYAGWLGTMRPAFNALRAIVRRPTLPPRGTVLAQGALLGAFVNTPDEWAPLWSLVCAEAHESGLSWLSISRDARDPELAVLRRLTRGREYRTTLYEVEWRDGPRWPDPWDGRVFRPEVGLL